MQFPYDYEFECWSLGAVLVRRSDGSDDDDHDDEKQLMREGKESKACDSHPWSTRHPEIRVVVSAYLKALITIVSHTLKLELLGRLATLCICKSIASHLVRIT